MNKQDIYKQVRDILADDEYSIEEVDEMLVNAVFVCDIDGVTVTYSNGVKDKFCFTETLVHYNDINYTSSCYDFHGEQIKRVARLNTTL